MSYPSIPLRELLVLHDTGVWGPEDEADGISVLRSTNFSPDGSVRFENLTYRSIEPSKRVSKRLEPNDIILEKSGGGPKQPVGRVCLFRGHHIAHAFGNFTARLRVKRTIVEPEFLFWCLRYLHLSGETLGYQKHTSGIRNLETKRYLSHLIPLPPLHEQRRVVVILNRAAKIERLQAQAQELMGEFLPALFIKMFGDPLENPMGWEQADVGDLSQVQSGLQVTKKRSEHPIEAPYLRVANVLRDRLNLSEIKRMRITEREFERVQLKLGDLLIVEGHGNASEIGRVGIWDGSICGCVHQNHLIRVRTDHSKILPEFASAYLNSSSGREDLLRSGKTTSGLNTISTSNVKSCDIFLPPLELQRQYTQLVESARSTVAIAESGTRTASELSASLMSQLLRACA